MAMRSVVATESENAPKKEMKLNAVLFGPKEASDTRPFASRPPLEPEITCQIKVDADAACILIRRMTIHNAWNIQYLYYIRQLTKWPTKNVSAIPICKRIREQRVEDSGIRTCHLSQRSWQILPAMVCGSLALRK